MTADETRPTDTAPDGPEPIARIPLTHSVRYAARGLPEVPHQYGRGVLKPSEITLTYRAAKDSQLGRVHAYVAGRLWDGREIPHDGLYGQHYDEGLDNWPAWLTEEARLHDPDAVSLPAEPDDTDVTEAEFDRAMAEGTPVQIATGPPDTHGASPDPLRDDLWDVIERAVYEYRELTCLWGETDGVTQGIADDVRRAVGTWTCVTQVHAADQAEHHFTDTRKVISGDMAELRTAVYRILNADEEFCGCPSATTDRIMAEVLAVRDRDMEATEAEMVRRGETITRLEGKLQRANRDRAELADQLSGANDENTRLEADLERALAEREEWRRKAVRRALAAGRLESALGQVTKWIASDVVTAKTPFGDGYREALRDIGDLIGPADQPTQEATDA